ESSGASLDDYFYLENMSEEMVFHQYHQCDICKVKPLWGIRFTCQYCDDVDLCEKCFDYKENLTRLNRPGHDESHPFEAIEYPRAGGGLAVHHERCAGCGRQPIVGYRFKCLECARVN